MNATPITIVADSATDTLRTARRLVDEGFARLTSHIGPLGTELRERLARGDVPAVVLVDLFMDITGPNFLRGLQVSDLDLGDAVVVVVTDDADAALAAGADLTVAPRDDDALIEALREASMRSKARSVNQLRRDVVRAA